MYQVRAQVIAVATVPSASASAFPFFLRFGGQKKGKADLDAVAEMENMYSVLRNTERGSSSWHRLQKLK